MGALPPSSRQTLRETLREPLNGDATQHYGRTHSFTHQPSRSGYCLDIHPLQMPHRLTCKAREDCLHIVASSLLPT